MYLEDDLQVFWQAMEAWAKATPALSAHGFLYGFFRTEVNPETGQLMVQDVRERVNVTGYNRTLHIPQVGSFLQLSNPYFGFWVATREQLLRFMGSGLWEKEAALTTNASHFGPLERANFLIQVIDIPFGFRSRSVVPFDPITRKLSLIAAVPHLRNNYANSHQFSIVPVDDLLY